MTTIPKDHLVIHKQRGFHNGPYNYLVNTYFDYVQTHYFLTLKEAEWFVKGMDYTKKYYVQIMEQRKEAQE